MVELGLNYGKGPLFLKEIAKREEISGKYLSQIIIPLKASGLVNSFRGAHGGYVLARPPSEITLREIVRLFEGDFTLVGCVKNPSECSRISVCVTRDLWSNLGKKIAQTLDSVTLDDLVNQCRKKRQNSVMYNI
jgi:Rrf2 family protein